MANNDWNKKNDVISEFINLKTQEASTPYSKGLDLWILLLLWGCMILFGVMLMKDYRTWVSLLVSGGIFFVLFFTIKEVIKRKQTRK